jgi:hypothetical protein
MRLHVQLVLCGSNDIQCAALYCTAAVYVMLYSLHYFLMKTKMTGFFQTAFYFGYTLMLCLGAF